MTNQINPTNTLNQAITTTTSVNPTTLHTNEFQFITINISAQAPLLKLTTNNYVSWKLQFQTLFIGYDFLGYVDVSKPCKPETLIVNNATTPNSSL